jgi:cyanophycin synthetase
MIRRGDMSGPKSARMILQNPTVDTAVFEVARGGILRRALGYDRNDIAVITNVTGDHLGIGGIDTLRQLADVKGVLVEAVPRSGTAVLNADDPNVSRMGSRCDGAVVYFSMETEKGSPGFDRVDGHCGRGGAAFVIRQTPEGDQIVLRHGPRTMPALFTHLVPATFGGKARMNVANALAAAAAAWASGAPARHPAGPADVYDLVLQAPGRLNYLEVARRAGRHRLLPQRRRDAQLRPDFVQRMMSDGACPGRAPGPGDRRHRRARRSA